MSFVGVNLLFIGDERTMVSSRFLLPEDITWTMSDGCSFANHSAESISEDDEMFNPMAIQKKETFL